MNKETVKMSLHLSPETNAILENLCEDSHVTKSELLRRSLALMQVAISNKKKGNHLVVLNDKGEKQGEIIGI